MTGAEYGLLRKGTILLTISIILATMFLKQHSVLDVLGAVLLNMLCYRRYYEQDYLNENMTKIPETGRLRRIREKG